MRLGNGSYREGQGQRAILALALSAALHVVVVVAALRPWGESALTGRTRIVFVEGHTGTYGPLRLMGDLNLSGGSDPVSQPALPPTAPKPQPKAVRVVRAAGAAEGGAPQDPDTPGEIVPTAMEAQAEGSSTAREVAAADARALPGPQFDGQVELNRPGQTSPDFVLLEFVRPLYPAGVPPVLRTRRIVVHVAMYVDLDGTVADAYVVSSEGGALFDDAVLVAVRQWKYRPLQVAGNVQPFWDQVKVTFVGSRPGTAPTVRVEGG